MRLADLRKKVGGPAQTTLRGHLRNLIEIGALEKRSRNGSNQVENELTPVGHEMLLVADVLEIWLSRCPDRDLNLENEAGKGSIKSLIGGWNSTMLRALAARPFSLTELDNLITAFTYPTLERRLSAMALAGQVVATQRANRGTPYAVTDWLRQGIAPLLASIHCEYCHLPIETAPLTRIDAEAILLLAVPLVTLPSSAGGTCQLTIDNRGENSKWEAGVSIEVKRGEIVALSSKLESRPPTSARGSAAEWFDAIVNGNSSRLIVNGSDRDLALGLVNGLHEALFAPTASALS